MSLIYVVEDEDNIRELVCYALTGSGFEAEGFSTSVGFQQKLKQAKPQLVLLDIMLPDEDGLSVLKNIRGHKGTQHLPVIMLTAKGANYDRALGLDQGADDYIVKPFSVLEMVARVRAVLRRAGQHLQEEVLSIGGITLDAEKHQVFAQDAIIELTLKEFELLHCLLRNREKVLTRSQLLSHVWGFSHEGGESRTVDMHIKTLRKKLNENGKMIKTVRGLGYKIEEK